MAYLTPELIDLSQSSLREKAPVRRTRRLGGAAEVSLYLCLSAPTWLPCHSNQRNLRSDSKLIFRHHRVRSSIGNRYCLNDETAVSSLCLYCGSTSLQGWTSPDERVRDGREDERRQLDSVSFSDSEVRDAIDKLWSAITPDWLGHNGNLKDCSSDSDLPFPNSVD